MNRRTIWITAAVTTVSALALAFTLTTDRAHAVATEESAVRTYVDSTVVPFLNDLKVMREELKAANNTRSSWTAYSEDWKKWSPEDAEKNKTSYTYGEYLWSAKKDKPFRNEHMTSKAAEALKAFVEKSEGKVAELFVTDAKGGNVCQGTMTSDWFQGDEEKFQKVDKKKELFFGAAKRDDTAGVTLVQVSVPIWDGETFVGFACVGVAVEKVK